MLELAFEGWEPDWLIAGFGLFKMPPLTDKGLTVLLVYKKKHTVPLKPEHLERITSRGCMPKLISSPVGRSSISATISGTEQPLDLVAEQHPCDERGLQTGTSRQCFQNTQGWALRNRWLYKLSPFSFIIKALLSSACQYSTTSERITVLVNDKQIAYNFQSPFEKGDVLVTRIGW